MLNYKVISESLTEAPPRLMCPLTPGELCRPWETVSQCGFMINVCDYADNRLFHLN